jgi:hypothetical protein
MNCTIAHSPTSPTFCPVHYASNNNNIALHLSMNSRSPTRVGTGKGGPKRFGAPTRVGTGKGGPKRFVTSKPYKTSSPSKKQQQQKVKQEPESLVEPEQDTVPSLEDHPSEAIQSNVNKSSSSTEELSIPTIFNLDHLEKSLTDIRKQYPRRDWSGNGFALRVLNNIFCYEDITKLPLYEMVDFTRHALNGALRAIREQTYDTSNEFKATLSSITNEIIDSFESCDDPLDKSSFIHVLIKIANNLQIDNVDQVIEDELELYAQEKQAALKSLIRSIKDAVQDDDILLSQLQRQVNKKFWDV